MRPVYSSSTAPGSFVPRNTMGYKDNGNHYNYMCGYINEFWSSYGPSQKELTERFPAVNCEVAASKNTPSGEAGHGRIYDFTYNNSTYCSGARPNNAPLDDYLPALVIALGMVGFFLIRDPLNPVVSLV
ncbi:hypothetical protein GJU39_05860 [Pedobacter petrophilus]|uniref:Uncharacterized protein n=1 Tax=Pedobacter petrophilus TaxID=1908241 RepID=A0A7K0FW07_9SPHI|nr:hypothetical protein [Pedobacter petrophilus]MRX75611.1 hypothetical protein [Pedobacter petrophilus]